MRVLLIRHAKAVPRGTPGIPDDDRPVTPEGEEKFRAAASGLARIVDKPAAILTSPLPRARRTAEIAAEAWGKSRVKEVEALADGSLAELTKVLASFSGDETVALVGHEPHLSSLLAHWLKSRTGDSVVFRKGGAALVELPDTPSKGGTLIWFIPPKILRSLAPRD